MKLGSSYYDFCIEWVWLWAKESGGFFMSGFHALITVYIASIVTNQNLKLSTTKYNSLQGLLHKMHKKVDRA